MKKELYGKLSTGEDIYLFTLENEKAQVQLINYGARIVGFTVDGVNTVAGYGSLDVYLQDKSSQGATVGRVANRIEDAQFTMDGAIYMLPANNKAKHCLHGGVGFHYRAWTVEEEGDNFVTLGYYSPDGEEGFPSGLMTKVKFILEGSALILDYEAVPEGKTPIALTNHSYFNLDGLGSTILEHKARIWADSYTAVNDELIPTGEHPATAGTVFDFSRLRPIGERFSDEFKGYDHNYVLCPEIYKEFAGKRIGLAATVTNGKLSMNTYTDQPGMQFYTANFLGGTPDFRDGAPRVMYGAFCLEAQTEPNCVKHGEAFYDAGEVYRQTTVYEIIKL